MCVIKRTEFCNAGSLMQKPGLHGNVAAGSGFVCKWIIVYVHALHLQQYVILGLSNRSFVHYTGRTL